MRGNARYYFSIVRWLLSVSLLVAGSLANAAAGRIAGTYSTTPDGAATYSIAIHSPLNAGGIQPTLSLVYNSRAGNGDFGPGWSLSGLGAISRCNKTIAQDVTPVQVKLVADDAYCLNGQRLVHVSGSYGGDGSTYRTELETFSRITAYVGYNAIPGTGPQYFIVEGKDGLTYTYGDNGGGNTGASPGIPCCSSGTAYMWLLQSVKDRNNNRYEVFYGDGYSSASTSPNTITISKANGAVTGSISFQYGPRSGTSATSGYVAGTLVTDNSQVTAIFSGPYQYNLSYEVAGSTPRARLKSIQKCTTASPVDCLASTVITYQNGQAGVATTATPVPASATRVFGAYDFNGDGRSDLAYAQSGLVYVTLATATGFAAPVSTGVTYTAPNGYNNPDVQFRDLLGNGKVGLFANQSGTWNYVSWNGSGFSSTGVIADPGSGYGHLRLADIDGDGRADLVYW